MVAPKNTDVQAQIFQKARKTRATTQRKSTDNSAYQRNIQDRATQQQTDFMNFTYHNDTSLPNSVCCCANFD
jgi:hypothetical protein